MDTSPYLLKPLRTEAEAARDRAQKMAATPGAPKVPGASVAPDQGHVSVAADIQRERIAEGCHPITGEELPWDDWDSGAEPSTDRLRELAGMYVASGDDP